MMCDPSCIVASGVDRLEEGNIETWEMTGEMLGRMACPKAMDLGDNIVRR